MAVAVLITTSLYPLTIYDIIEGISTIKEIPLEKRMDIVNNRSTILITLIAIHVTIIAILFIICIRITHKTAGPIYKVISYFRDIRDGNGFREIYFREGDHFPELADEVNLLSSYLDEKINSDLVYLNEVKSYIKNLALIVPDDKKPVMTEIIKKLDKIQKQYKL